MVEQAGIEFAESEMSDKGALRFHLIEESNVDDL
jgi:hypothetical protein